MKRSKIIYLCIIFLGLLFCVSAYKIGSYLWEGYRQEASFRELKELIQSYQPEVAQAPQIWEQQESLQEESQPSEQTSEGGQAQEQSGGQINMGYALLHQRNPDLFGWICIPDTRVNYPVMHTPGEPEYYLRRDFDKKNSRGGVPFMDATCFTGCGNYLIYGHNMKNGTMFHTLLSYDKKEFWQEHPVVRFDTLEHTGEYEIMSVFYTEIYPSEMKEVFRYYWYTDLTDQSRFEEYVAQVKALSLYDTDVEAVYGDELLTLSTCSYHAQEGRFVVVARKSTPPLQAPRPGQT